MDIASIPFGTRQKMLYGGLGDEIRNSLTAGQMASMFPNYYKEGINGLAGQKSDSSAGGGPSAPASGYSPAHTGTGTYTPPPGAPPSATPAPKTGLTPSEFRRIEANPYLAGYGDNLPRQGNATMGQGTNTQGNFTPRERATLNFISNREGARDPNIIFGGERYKAALGLDKKPLTEMSVAEVLEMQKKMTQLTAAEGIAGGRGTSAVGTGQMVRGTLIANLQALGIPEDQWGSVKFDQTLQERLTLQNFKSSGIGDPNGDPNSWNMTRLGAQYESLDTSKGFPPMSQAELQSIATASPQLEIPPNSTASPVNAPPQQDAGALAAVENPGQTSGQNAGAEAADRGKVTIGKEGEEIGIGDTSTIMGRSPPGSLTGVDPRMQVVGDAAIRAFERNNPGYTVRVISGARPGAVTSSGHPSKHGEGAAIDYEIVGPDGKALPSLGQPDHSSGMGVGEVVGDSAPKYFELMKNMEAARVKMGEKDPSYVDMGRVSPGLFFKNGAWMDSMHASFGENGQLGDIYSGFKSPDQLRAEGTDPQIIRAVERAIAAGAPVQGQGEPMKEEDMQAYATALFSGQGSAVSQIARAPTQAESLLALASQSTSPHAPATVTPAPSTTEAQATADASKVVSTAPTAEVAKANTTPAVQGSQELAAVENPDASTVPTLAMASGGMISEPHTAINDRTGAITKLGEKGTGGEAVIPMNKVNAAELGQQPYQMPQPPAPEKEPVIQQVMMPSALPGKQEEPTNNYSSEPPEQGATLGKAYARARMSNYTPSNDYVSFGHPVV